MQSFIKFNQRRYMAIRLILGALLLATAMANLIKSPEETPFNSTGLKAMRGLWETGYLVHLLNLIKLGAAVTLLSNSYVRLLNIVLMPVLIGTILFNLFDRNSMGLIANIPLYLLNIWLMLMLMDVEADKSLLNHK
jgi:hypothetical protein